MKDLGSKQSVAAMKAPLERWYPNVTVDAEDFPSLKAHALGKDHHVRMKVRKTGEHINKRHDGKTEHKIDLELRGMEEERKPRSIADAGHMIRDEEE